MFTKKFFLIVLVVLMALATVSLTAMSAPMSADASTGNNGNGNANGSNSGMSLGNQEEGRLLIKFKSGSHKGNVPELGNAEDVGSLSQLGVKVMKVKNPKAIAKLVANNKHIEYIEEDTVEELTLAPTDPSYKSYGSGSASIMNAERGWDIKTSSSVTVAVLDTGFNPHPDLPTPARVYNAVSRNSNVADLNGHGTLVSGTLCALANNGLGGAGIIWDYSNLMFIRISEQAGGSAYVSDMTNGILYAADNGAKIISISYGGATDNVTRQNAINYAVSKGCIIFAATGNEAASSVCFPARNDNVIGVGALSSPTAKASYSNGGTGLDIMASGSWYAPNYNGGYSIWSGTSCATPIAAGIAALVWDMLPSYSNTQIVQFLKNNAKDLGTAGWDAQTGYGVADMQILLSKAAELRQSGAAPTQPVAPPTPPTVETVPPAPPVDTTAPVLTLSGSANITLFLGEKFVEPGYKALDDTDGDITHKVTVSGSVNINTAGTYTLTYAVSDEAGNTAKAVRTVNVTANTAVFNYSHSGKAGASFTDSFKPAFPGIATITAPGVDAKTQVTITIKDASNNTVFTSAFAANTAKTVNLSVGSYTAVSKIDSTNGNTAFSVNITLIESEAPPPPAPDPVAPPPAPSVPRTAPSVKLNGSAQIVLHLDGSPYVEQGVTATDTVDGSIGSWAVVASNVDTSKAGNYTVKYTVTNTESQSASVTRNVEIIAPQTRAATGKAFSFAPKGKQGENFNYSFDASISGSAALTLSGLNKVTALITVKDAAGKEVYKNTASANGTFNFNVTAGKYTVSVTLVEANGNASFSMNLSTPGGTETYFAKAEITK
ncbi:MAG: S8 family serine peptidase [Firmicutes bacterium]|nr:S8 family serine peptidase [Bacillota bacterium]